MFNLGSDDKDELQENMKEIKDMIQREDRGSQNREVGDSFGDETQDFGANQDTGFDQDTPSVPESSPGRNQEKTSPTVNQEQPQSQSQSRRQENHSSERDSMDAGIPDRGVQKSQDQESQRRKQPENEKTSQSPGNREVVEQHSQDRQQQEEEDSRREIIRSEPKKKVEDKKSREPLFLNEDEFREVREMVEEMSYLSREIQDNLDRMKKSVRKERENSKNINELIDAYSERRSSIETAIETGQK